MSTKFSFLFLQLTRVSEISDLRHVRCLPVSNFSNPGDLEASPSSDKTFRPESADNGEFYKLLALLA